MFNATDHFLAPDRHAAEHPLLTDGVRALTRADLATQAGFAGEALRGLGVMPEQRVMLLLNESLEFAACFWGALRIGAVAVPANPLLTPAEHRHFLIESRAKALLVDAALWPAIAPHLSGIRTLRHVVTVNGEAGDVPQWDHLTARAARLDSVPEAEPMSRDDIAVWLYTSGSTGVPKAVLHRAQDLIAASEIFPREVLRLRPGELTFSAARMGFAYGMGNTLLFPLSAGATALIHPARPVPESLFATIAAHRPSVFYAGPATFHAMLATNHARRDRAQAADAVTPDLASLRVSVSAGEALPAELAAEWRRTFGHEILDCVGSTENLTFFLANRIGRSRPGSAGQAVPGFDLRLADDAGHDAAPGEVGTLWVRGPTAAPRYWRRETLSRAVMRGEWLVTGDRFVRGADGAYRHLGRDDDLFKVGGSWVSPVEVEHALLSYSDVEACAVVGHRDSAGLGRGVAFIVPRAGALAPEGDPSPLEAALRAHLNSRVAAFKIPAAFRFVPELPCTPTGKVRRAALRETLSHAAPAAVR